MRGKRLAPGSGTFSRSTRRWSFIDRSLILAFALAASPLERADAAASNTSVDLASALADAKVLARGVNGCNLGGIPNVRRLLRLYEHRPEQELRIVSARARLAAGFAYRFREETASAKLWYLSVVKRYGGEQAAPFKHAVAQANLELARITEGRSEKAKYLARVTDAYGETDDLDLLQVYANALNEKADLLQRQGLEAEAQGLSQRAQAIYQTRIIPRLNATPPTLDDICI